MRTILLTLAAVAAAALLLGGPANARVRKWPTPAWFYPQALCVHSGWHYTKTRYAKDADYIFGPGLAFRRTWDVPDSIKGGSGEAGWDEINSYGGGMQFMLGTWHRAGGWARTVADIAHATPAEQIYRAYVIVVRHDRGSWREWPQTSVACGL